MELLLPIENFRDIVYSIIRVGVIDSIYEAIDIIGWMVLKIYIYLQYKSKQIVLTNNKKI